MIDAHTIETLRLRTAALHRIGRANDALHAEIRDREATEADVRARLADAERERDELRAKVEAALRPTYVPCPDHKAVVVNCDHCWAYAAEYEAHEAVRAVLDGKP